ncbi:hypothetical protein FOS14_12200 [Skermania sp. ID1734]|uniref:type IV toxin-antitoxin system AbiEi family antitoxin domain-containing protein n=1 Tax=Skermania sp. ID1734 TaxID=2597516 RepID=UPI0011805524|nr:type IV toxin-antitoxin system AbiEi family antitoxin domain-containing protein [Skermania sp. ID1734]TSD99528.1 hypothetical protein FOS14_12200 [Skermania sp. ID1734]
MTGIIDASSAAPSWSAVMQTAADQGGYVTAGQILRCGVGAREFADAIAAGRLIRIRRDLLRVPSGRISRFDDLAQCCAWFEGAATVSHHTAAELHGMGRLHPAYTHICVGAMTRPPVPRVAVHRRFVQPGEVGVADGFRVTTPARTVVDLAAVGVGQLALNEVVADGMAIGRLAVAEVLAAVRTSPRTVIERVERALSAC